MPFKIEQPFEYSVRQNISILIYGQPGLGKTTLAVSAPAPLLIDADRGAHRLDAFHRVPRLIPERYTDVVELLNSPAELAKYETIVVDTCGKLALLIDDYNASRNPRLLQGDGTLTKKGWGARGAVFDAFRAKILSLGKNIVFVAHEKEDRNGETRRRTPDFGGGASGDRLIADIDAVGYMEAIGSRRTISFAPNETYMAKNGARLEDRFELPELSDENENSFLTNILTRLTEAARKENPLTLEYRALIAEIDSAIECITDAESANAAVPQLAEMRVMGSSKEHARAALSAKCRELGLTFNRETKLYEGPEPVQAEAADEEEEAA